MLDLTSQGFRINTRATLQECALLLRQGAELWPRLPSSGPIIVEFDNVTDLDSSLLALLLEWQDHAEAQSRKLELKNPPANLQHLAHLYGVADWIDGLAA